MNKKIIAMTVYWYIGIIDLIFANFLFVKDMQALFTIGIIIFFTCVFRYFYILEDVLDLEYNK